MKACAGPARRPGTTTWGALMLWNRAATCSRAASRPRAWSSSENTTEHAYATTPGAVLASVRLAVAEGVGEVSAQSHAGAEAGEVALHAAGVEPERLHRVLAERLADPVRSGVVGHEGHGQLAAEAILERAQVPDAEPDAQRRIGGHLLPRQPEALLLGEPVKGRRLDLHQAAGAAGADRLRVEIALHVDDGEDEE